jgi:hypothetical protein
MFVPKEYRQEVEQLSKAALMDIAWDYAAQCANCERNSSETDDEIIMREFRNRRAIIEVKRIEHFRR